jgi:hypothetical protein
MRNFTLASYDEILRTAVSHGIPICGVADWFQSQPIKGIMMRHDVDRRANNALLMARCEAKHGIKSTYYFRITKGSFQPQVIREIAALGHEIGYHYEDLAVAKGDTKKAIAQFAENLEKLRIHAQVTTIAMHGSPLSPFDNRDLWKSENFEKFGIVAEALLTIDYRNIYYLTDAGRSWEQRSVNLRDHVKNALSSPVKTTQEFCVFLKNNPNARYAVSCHPERWDDPFLPWGIQYLKDISINSIKRGLRLFRRNSRVL